MLFRSMGWGNSYQMTAAIVLPVLPFVGLVWVNTTKRGPCCALTVVAMLAVMRYRRSKYSMQI